MTPISIILPVRNEGARLLRTISSIINGRVCGTSIEIVIIDDASTDDACQKAMGFNAPEKGITVVLMRLPIWSGIPFARNRGSEIATHSIFVITDANTVFTKGWDCKIAICFRRDKLLCGNISDLNSQFQGYGCQLELPSMGVTWIPIPYAYGEHVPISPCTFTVIDRDVFEYLGGYNESLKIYGAAEPEFSLRAWLTGYEIINAPNLQIFHLFKKKVDQEHYLRTLAPTILKNYIKFACLYLPEKLLNLSYAHYEKNNPEQFTQWLSEMDSNEGWKALWRERGDLESRMVRDFAWFAAKFEMPVRRSLLERNRLGMPKLTVVILTHDNYFNWLPEILRAVRQQSSSIEDIILVINSNTRAVLDPQLATGVTIINRKFDRINEARNCGLDYVRTEWVCYVDGDNTPDDEYFHDMRAAVHKVPGKVAIVYPNIRRIREDGKFKDVHIPDWDYWTSREKSIIDTCSAWRVRALRQIGGWFVHAECLQDYTTALRLTGAGWEARRARSIRATLRDHEENVHKRQYGISGALWKSRKLIVVTLFAGRYAPLASLIDWYSREEFPPDTHWIWFDDSQDENFQLALREHANNMRNKAVSIEIWKNNATSKDISNFSSLHNHVASLYNKVFDETCGDIYLTVEDDVIAPIGSVKQILGSFALIPNSKWAGICAIYPSRTNSEFMCASTNPERWTPPKIVNFPVNIIAMGMIGAGFAAWSGAAIKKSLPLGSSTTRSGYTHGWDGSLSRTLKNLGYIVGIDGSISCLHLTK